VAGIDLVPAQRKRCTVDKVKPRAFCSGGLQRWRRDRRSEQKMGFAANQHGMVCEAAGRLGAEKTKGRPKSGLFRFRSYRFREA
jgi:hypothetical protein